MNLQINNEIHVWYAKDVEIQDAQLLREYISLLSNEEWLQYNRFYFPEQQHQYLVTRTLVRYVLSLYDQSKSPQSWKFIHNKFGKPSIQDSALSFNISHTHHYTFMALAIQNKLGIDIEKLVFDENLLHIAKIHFTKKEIVLLNSMPKDLQTEMFYTFWTLKEAYTKACGQGLSIALDTICFANKSKISARLNACGTILRDWQFWQFFPDKEYIVSLATDNPETKKICIFKALPLRHYEEVEFKFLRSLIKH